ncbi:UDP-glucose 4-epimerase [Labilithrix luteola]|uniref:UDP-glucose 4-epimerase n=1 Tax=Labilithrix luteola TaxID=1391654 RepID=A0A0K1QB71_9BACT|nr:SDR family oxidoreductase [Labilithrix luteola]AKV02989.1 UDP-glucose 4-epimerase [Labilithrix luteola]
MAGVRDENPTHGVRTRGQERSNGSPDSAPRTPRSGQGPGSSPSSVPRPLAARGRGTVLVTGACGRLGKHFVRALHRERRVIAVDRRPFPDKPKDVVHEQVDIRRKKLKDIFRAEPIEAVVHLGIMHDPRASQAEHHSWNVAGFQKLLEYVAQFQVPKLVVLSSSNVYGPQPDNAQFLKEESPLLGGARFSEIRDLIEVDMLAQGFFWKHPETETVILRPVHILGAVHNAASNFLRLPTIPTLMGFDPMVQVVHESDVVRALERTLTPGKRGIYNLAGPGPLPLSHIVKLLGKPSVPVPYSLGKAVLKRLWSFRLTTFPAPELDHIRYVCMVDDTRARDELGYAPETSIEDTVRSVDGGRW